MTINRRWIAREWLFLLTGFVWAYVLSPILTGLLTVRSSDVIAFGPYVIFQLVRITMWAIRTVREPK